jgi:myo-inositol-1(or 4)-monophosphatase
VGPEQLDAVQEIAQLGADQLMRFWRSLDPSQVTEKAANDLVSEADYEAERAILGAIASRFPDHHTLAEESGASPGRIEGVPVWIVDPLDGTTNFVHGHSHFAVSVGVALDGEMQLGVILDPVRGDVFRAARGHGAWWNGRRCRVSEHDRLAGALLATGFPFRAHQFLDPYLAIFRDVFLRCKAIRRIGSAALDLAHVSVGLFDGFFEFGLSPWDLAAGSLLVEEAGGRVSDMSGGAAFMDSGHVVCGPPGVHRELLSVIQLHRQMWSPLVSSAD